ncbi:MAG: FtsX-like permease family protein [Butyrivibrio sp.]|nr:FtsX-like permease family protein [Butyrivibrio sp.]
MSIHYLGLTYSAYALGNAGKKLYSSTNFRDIQITSNCMLSPDDLEEVKQLEGIEDAEGIYRLNGRLVNDVKASHIYVSSLTKKIGTPMLTEGALPASKTECIVEENLSKKHELSIGDTIKLQDNYGEAMPELNDEEYVITGFFKHAEHASFDLDENYCVLVTAEAFDMDRLDNCYSLIDITLKDANPKNLYDTKYFDLVEEYEDKLEELANKRTKTRYDEHLAFLKDQIDDSEKDLKDAKSQLDFAGKMVPSLQGKTGQVMADMSNMLSVLMFEEPSEYKTADEQVSDYYDALKSYNSAIKRVDDAKKRYNKLVNYKEGKWYVFNRNANNDFVFLKNNSDHLHNLNMSFSVLFVIIAVMVIFASLSRMVQEQRSLIGISKAIGMHFKEIFSKYFTFGISASILGIILGIILSYTIIELVVGIGFEDHFIFGRFPAAIDVIPTIVTVIIALMVAFFSIYVSCSGLLKQTAKKLMSPVIPKGHAKALEKSPFLKRLNLYNRMILLNIRTDIVRVIVTIISIAGCCSLIVIGFSLRSSIKGSMDRQLNTFTSYDGIVNVSTSLHENAITETQDIIDSYGLDNQILLHQHGSIEIDDTMEYVEFMISDDLEALSKFHPLIDFKARKPYEITGEDGLIITNRMSELYHLKRGDTVEMIDELGFKHTAVIAGVVKNYIGRYVVLTKSYYESVMNDTYNYNAFFVNADDQSLIDNMLLDLEETSGYESYSPSSELVDTFRNLMVVLNMIVVLLTVLSGVMALFVLLNLANMYLLSKKAELVIMRINGFTVKETIRYAIREVIFTTFWGIILGIIFGCLMVYSILRNMEAVHLMFVREPNIVACVLGAVITAAFTAGIYAISMRKVQALSFSDM